MAVDCCDRCLSCQKIEHGNHADVFWVRPESKSRQINIGQIVRREDSPPRVLLDAVNLKPTESQYKVGVIVAADRMNEEAANAFLKTLEEPPPRSVLILLTTEPQRLLETILSRCLRLNFAGEGPQQLAPAQLEWLATFSEMAAAEQKSLLGRYRLMDVLLRKLNQVQGDIEETLTARSPLEKYEDAEEELREKWEEELKAAIEAEYRRQRADFLLALQWWLRDVWLQTLGSPKSCSPESISPQSGVHGKVQREPGGPGFGANGTRHSSLLTRRVCWCFPNWLDQARGGADFAEGGDGESRTIIEQLQRWLSRMSRKPLALEVGLLKLHCEGQLEQQEPVSAMRPILLPAVCRAALLAALSRALWRLPGWRCSSSATRPLPRNVCRFPPTPGSFVFASLAYRWAYWLAGSGRGGRSGGGALEVGCAPVAGCAAAGLAGLGSRGRHRSRGPGLARHGEALCRVRALLLPWAFLPEPRGRIRGSFGSGCSAGLSWCWAGVGAAVRRLEGVRDVFSILRLSDMKGCRRSIEEISSNRIFSTLFYPNALAGCCCCCCR